jgi:hypothetical protein
MGNCHVVLHLHYLGQVELPKDKILRGDLALSLDYTIALISDILRVVKLEQVMGPSAEINNSSIKKAH